MAIETVQTETKKAPAGQAAGFHPEALIVAPRHIRLVVGLPPVTIWRLRKAGLFPEPIRLSAGRIGWRRSDLEAWLAEREQCR